MLFPVPPHHSSRKLVRFSWSGSLYEFLCSCFGLGLAPKIFKKLLKIPISIMRRIDIWRVIYLDDMRTIGQMMEGIIMFRGTVTFLVKIWVLF